MKSPVSSFARSVWSPGDLDEAVIEAEVVSETVLPPLSVLAVIWKVVHDELVNF